MSETEPKPEATVFKVRTRKRQESAPVASDADAEPKKKPISKIPKRRRRPDSTSSVDAARARAAAAADAGPKQPDTEPKPPVDPDTKSKGPDTPPPSPDTAPAPPDTDPDGPDAGDSKELLKPMEKLDPEQSGFEKMGELGKAGWDKTKGTREAGWFLAGITALGIWKPAKFVGRTSMRALDRTGSMLDSLGEGLMRLSKWINGGKPVPGTKHVESMIDWLKEKTGFKKRLYERLKEDKEARKELAKKLHDQMIKDEKKWEKAQKAKAKKSAREKKLKKRFGDGAGALLFDEITTIEKDAADSAKDAA